MTDSSEDAETGTDLRDRTVVVAGLGVTGPSVVRALLGLGARVVAVDGRDRPRERELAEQLRALGATVLLGDGTSLPDGAELVITSPGWRPDSPLLAAATAAGLEIWGDVELAYRLRPAGQEWLGVTGTNGKTTTVQMLAAILQAAGHRAVATGNVGFPVLDAVLADPPYDVLAVEVSSFQLHWTTTVEFISGAILNIAPDHLDWHGSLEAYAADKALVWRSDWYAVYNADDPLVASLVTRVDDRQSFSARPGSDACFGVAGDVLVDRCIGTVPGERVERAPGGGVVLGRLSDIPVPGAHNVANALAAAGLARCLNSATGGRLAVHPQDVGAGLRAFDPGPHRIAHVATVEGVEYVDDSKATNAHAAAASLSSYPSVVWVAGGLAKGGTFDELVTTVRDRLRGAVLIGADRSVVAEALARHAPEIPVVEVERTDTGAMETVVREAARLAQRGDTVLLAPACASMDMFRDYAERGDAFAAAVRQLPGAGEAAGPAS